MQITRVLNEATQATKFLRIWERVSKYEKINSLNDPLSQLTLPRTGN